MGREPVSFAAAIQQWWVLGDFPRWAWFTTSARGCPGKDGVRDRSRDRAAAQRPACLRAGTAGGGGRFRGPGARRRQNVESKDPELHSVNAIAFHPVRLRRWQPPRRLAAWLAPRWGERVAAWWGPARKHVETVSEWEPVAAFFPLLLSIFGGQVIASVPSSSGVRCRRISSGCYAFDALRSVCALVTLACSQAAARRGNRGNKNLMRGKPLHRGLVTAQTQL